MANILVASPVVALEMPVSISVTALHRGAGGAGAILAPRRFFLAIGILGGRRVLEFFLLLHVGMLRFPCIL